MGMILKKLKNWRSIALIVIITCALLFLCFTTNMPSKLSMIDEYISHARISSQFGTNDLYELQWWLSNDGSFNSFDDSPAAWGVDKKLAKAGIDLNIGEAVLKIEQKRPLLIAVIDTGVDINHPAISDGIFVNSNEIKDDGIDNDANGYIDDYMGWDFYDNDNDITSSSSEEMIHGTAMISALIGDDKAVGYRSVMHGYNIKIICIRVLGGKTVSGNLKNIADAICYAEEMGAEICGMAINTDIDSQYLKNVMLGSEMLFVVSAGNEGLDLNKFDDNFPTTYELSNVISVADLRCDGLLSKTSNYGSRFVDIAAPGTNILCAKSGGGYEFYSGTSLSVFLVVSEAALIYIKSTDVLPAQNIKKLIVDNVIPMKTLCEVVIAGGIPNYNQALASTL